MNIILTGATGFVGGGVLLECLQDERVEKILCVVRRTTGISHPKLTELVVRDFSELKAGDERLAGYDACLYCAGISSVGMKEDAYYQVTYTTTMQFVDALPVIPNLTFIYVSGAGTRSDEKGMMWTRVKGKTENDLLRKPFKRAYMFRPAVMRAHKGQTNLKGMPKFYSSLFPIFKLLSPSSANTLEQVGRAMITAAKDGYGKSIIETRDITALAK